MSIASKEEIPQDQREAFVLAAEAMNSKLDEIVERVERGEAKEIVIPAAAGANPALQATPPSLKKGAESAESAAAPSTPRPAPQKALTDEEIFNKVALFLDPELLGPIFISQPINRKVFIAKYPTFGEMLTAERLLGIDTRSAEGDLKQLFEVIAELQQVVLGWTTEKDPVLDLIKQHPGDPSKWIQKLRKFNTTASRDPRVQYEIPVLWGQYLAWKIEVTPTDDEMEKYSGLIS